MPIRINLLAEALAAEEERRKDPVKRVAMAATVVVCLVAAWCGTLQFKLAGNRRVLSGLESKWQTIEGAYKSAVDNQRQSIEAEEKLAALQLLTTNRFLLGSLLDAFQHTLEGVDDVQLVRLRIDQAFTSQPEVGPRTNGTIVVPAQPATATEKVTVNLDAMDASVPIGRQVTRYKDAIAAVPYFRDNLQKTNGVMLTSRAAPQVSASGGQPFVQFQLQCNFPENTR
jgi:hypothetical protein